MFTCQKHILTFTTERKVECSHRGSRVVQGCVVDGDDMLMLMASGRLSWCAGLPARAAHNGIARSGR